MPQVITRENDDWLHGFWELRAELDANMSPQQGAAKLLETANVKVNVNLPVMVVEDSRNSLDGFCDNLDDNLSLDLAAAKLLRAVQGLNLGNLPELGTMASFQHLLSFGEPPNGLISSRAYGHRCQQQEKS